MELKVSVDGIQRVVCGVTEKTTCQEVVIALAQSLGRTGRYTLKEKFKEFERNVTPSEQLLESLGKYGQQAREVQLCLQHNGPLLKVDNPVSGATLRKVEGSVRGWTAGGAKSLHRQSLPPLSCLKPHTEPPQGAEAKKPKRKSLILMEEARGWLESFSWSTRREKGKAAGSENGELRAPRVSQEIGSCEASIVTAMQKRASILHESSSKQAFSQTENAKIGQVDSPDTEAVAQKFGPPGGVDDALHKLISRQQARLRELQGQIRLADIQINKLVQEHCTRQGQEIWQTTVEDEGEDEEEQLKYWENELKAEEVYECELQEHFLEMKQKAAECKVRLEEYKFRLQRLDEKGTFSSCMPQPGTVHAKTRVCSQEEAESTAASTPTGDPSATVLQIFPYQVLQFGPREAEQLRQCWARTSILLQSEVPMHLSSTRV